jgi:hypothetical protein
VGPRTGLVDIKRRKNFLPAGTPTPTPLPSSPSPIAIPTARCHWLLDLAIHCSAENNTSQLVILLVTSVPSIYIVMKSVPLWSSGHEFLATDPGTWARFPALPDFLRSSGPRTRSTQPREYN